MTMPTTTREPSSWTSPHKKNESGMGTVKIKVGGTIQTWDGLIQGDPKQMEDSFSGKWNPYIVKERSPESEKENTPCDTKSKPTMTCKCLELLPVLLTKLQLQVSKP